MCCRHLCSLVCNPVCVYMFERVATYIKRAKTKNDQPQRLSPAGTQSSLEALCIGGRIRVWVLSRRCCCSAVCGGTCCTKPDSCTHWRKKSQLDHSISCQESPSHSDKQTHSDRNACVQFSIHSLPKNIPLWVGFIHRLLKHRGCCVICSPRLFRPNSGGRARTHSTECALECGNLATGPERQIRLAMGDRGSSA